MPDPFMMQWAISVLVVSRLALQAGSANPPAFAVRHISVDQGLSQSHVTAIAQDQQGFVWIGTAVGLNRYDGHTFRVYQHDPASNASLSDDAVYALHVDQRGNVWVGTRRGLDRYDPATDSFQQFGALSTERSGFARAIDSDSRGDIWAAIKMPDNSASVLTRLTPATRQIRRYSVSLLRTGDVVFVRALDEHRILFIFRDPAGRTYRTGFSVGILNPQTGAIRELSQNVPAPLRGGTQERDLTFAMTGPDSIWVGARGNQVFRVDLKAGAIVPYAYAPDLTDAGSSGLVSHVVQGRNGAVWVLPTWHRAAGAAKDNAIYTISGPSFQSRKNLLKPSGPCDLTRSFVISSHIDQGGELWAGISGAGLCVADLESGLLSHIHESSRGVSLSNNFVRSVVKTHDGTLWVGTRSGVDRIDRDRSTVQRFYHRPEVAGTLSDDEVRTLLVSRDGALWVGTQRGGLNRSVKQNGVFEVFRHDSEDPSSIGSNHVSSLLEDRTGTLWVGTRGAGLNRFNPSNKKFTTFRHYRDDSGTISSDYINVLLEDSKGGFWIGTEDAGLNRFDRASGRFSGTTFGLPEPPNILSLAEDRITPGILWVGTLKHGVIRYDTATQSVSRYTTKNSPLSSDTIYSVLPDDHGAVWLGTNRGLIRFDRRANSFQLFGVDQGLQSMEFNTGACFRAGDGELLMGGVGGLNTFYPREITQNALPAKIAITQVRAVNRQDRTGVPYIELFHTGGRSHGVELGSGTRDLIFNFVALHFADPLRNIYKVKLEGFDVDWRDVGTSREISYTNLPPGDYKFVVRAATSRGVWSDARSEYHFHIAAPFYRTPWFVTLAVALLISAAVGLHRWRLRRLRGAKAALESIVQKRTQELSSALDVIGKQADQLRESDALKSRFLTNVSHELRTPLSITLGTIADVQAGLHGPISDGIARQLATVVRNERKLLRLVNQLLAIARIDSGKLRLKVFELDVATLARDVVATFAFPASQRQVSLACESEGPAVAFVDGDWMEEVIGNLVSNALKFSRPGGRVCVRVSREEEAGLIRVAVQDEGPGLAPEDTPRVFDRFYQTELGATSPQPGIGVGLALAKEIVELHTGEIRVTSEPGVGSTFEVLLRTGKAHFDADQLVTAPSTSETRSTALPEMEERHAGEQEGFAPVTSGEKATILVAEDNPDLRAYLLKHLQASYRVVAASSGDEAWRLVQSEIPDSVITDIMMPGMDGLQLCEAIRSTPETEFIPVLFLTARTGLEHKLEGLSRGAHDYIGKPFEIAELTTKLRNLLDSRVKLRSRIAADLALDTATSLDEVPESSDAAFVRRVYNVIRERAHEMDFSVEQLADELALSRMHLYRRLRATIGKAPADVLMEYRLERASQLLAGGCGSISEVAYGLGFKSVSHFTRRFREQFGQTPTEYRAAGQRSPAANA